MQIKGSKQGQTSPGATLSSHALAEIVVSYFNHYSIEKNFF